MAVAPAPRADRPKGLLRAWRTPICAGAVVGAGAAAMVVFTHATAVDVLWPVSLCLAAFFLSALADRKLIRRRRA